MIIQDIEFLGGPFDGFELPSELVPADISRTITLPLNENVHRMLSGEDPGPKAPAKTVAIYRLDTLNQRMRYHFVGVALAEHLNLTCWHV